MKKQLNVREVMQQVYDAKEQAYIEISLPDRKLKSRENENNQNTLPQGHVTIRKSSQGCKCREGNKTTYTWV